MTIGVSPSLTKLKVQETLPSFSEKAPKLCMVSIHLTEDLEDATNGIRVSSIANSFIMQTYLGMTTPEIFRRIFESFTELVFTVIFLSNSPGRPTGL